jgi:hypothetical protein
VFGGTVKPALAYLVGTGSALGALLVIMYVSLHSIGFSLKGLDFLFLYTPARLFLEGHGSQLYNYPFFAHAEATIADPTRIAHGGMPNVYPPYVAVILAPLAALPYVPAYFVWLALNALLFVLCLYCLETYAGLSRRQAFAARLASLLFLPAVLALFQGQSTMWVLAAWVATVLSLRAGRDGLAGVALAASLVKPQYVLPWLLVLVLYRRWRALAWFAGSAIVLVAISLLAFGPGIVTAYAESVVQAAGYRNQFGGFDNLANRGLGALFGTVLPSPAAGPVTLAADVAALALLCVQALRWRSLEVSLGLAAVTALLISPHVLIHDLTLVLIPIAVTIRFFRSLGTALVLVVVYVGIVAGFALTSASHVQLVTLPILLLVVWMLLASRQQLSADAQREDLVSNGTGQTQIAPEARSSAV